MIDDDDSDDDSDLEDRIARSKAANKGRLQRLSRSKDSKVNKKGGNAFSISALKSVYGVESDDDELQEQEEALELEEYLREQQRLKEGGGASSRGGGGGHAQQIVTRVLSAGVKPQLAFQPGSTPADANQRRFLAWNTIGRSVFVTESVRTRAYVSACTRTCRWLSVPRKRKLYTACTT